MRILFLDDDNRRHDYFEYAMLSNSKEHEVVHVHSAKAAIDALINNERFDLVHLDHDLGYGSGNNGYEVAVFISTMSDSTIPRKIVLHSSNQVGAERMLARLEDLTEVQVIPFSI